MSTSLWPDFAELSKPPGMSKMLIDAAGDIDQQTNGVIDFFVDSLGVGEFGSVSKIRYNCYLRIKKRNYNHLLFRVTTPLTTHFPAELATPEGEEYLNLPDVVQLRDTIGQVLKRERTKEIVFSLLQAAH